ncbi:hypothetical protein FW605_09535 [Campylobacter coli]|uniref:Uncharacterized protein n=14 Tax=Campylobacter TaxID=194 RepID=A0A1E7NV23_CAMJU|nr:MULTISPECIES: hypothetical protein [Campylobacter]MBZ7939802.1 hypothetical protein [Campylobacter sp. W0014]EAB5264166.1 hypothetical protein [Campylobacter jejuni]EAB5363775.1 hypothetical protein [Campylobacter jejuni]EAH4546707.1 hypothetical protein [Campylobacter jejuni]EAH4558620.1 hypothetical protein [Campylobacter jejuni]
MKTIKIPLKDYISNIREDKTIYLGLQSDMSIKGLDEEFLKKEYNLKRNFKFETSIYLGKIIIKEKNIIFKAFNIGENCFEGLKELFFKNNPYKIIDNLELKKYFLKLYKDNIEFLTSYINEINQVHGIKLYYIENKNLNKFELISMLDEMVQKNDYEVVDFSDDLFYSYLVWSLRKFIIAYDIGLYQDKNNLFFNLATYKIHKNHSFYIEASNHLNFNLIELFFSNTSPLEYAVGYLQKEEIIYNGALEYSLGTLQKTLNTTTQFHNKFYFKLKERPFEYAQYFKQK